MANKAHIRVGAVIDGYYTGAIRGEGPNVGYWRPLWQGHGKHGYIMTKYRTSSRAIRCMEDYFRSRYNG